MNQSISSKYKLSLLSLFIGMGISNYVLGASGAVQQQTNIISLDKKININKVEKRPVIEIMPTDSNGMSHNKYEKFNVAKPGIDINNATENPAKIILNEIISNDKTRISGNINILGDSKPHFIIANPTGIDCSDCSVTNVGRLTLTTAKISNMLDNGQMTDKFTYDTKHGQIRFKNVKSEKFTDAAISRVFARSINLQSCQLNVNDISLIAGKNRLEDVDNPKYINITGYNQEYNSRKIKLTIDANSTINANDSYLHTSSGKLENHGVINSSGILNISSVNSNIFNQKELIAENQNYTFISTNFANFGVIKSKGSLAINGQDSVIINNNKIVANNQDYNLLLTSLTNNKTIQGNDSVKITALHTDIKNNDQLIAKNQEYQLVDSQFKNNEEGTITAYDISNVDNANHDTVVKLDITLINKASFVDEGQIAIGAQENDKPTVFPIGKATRYQYGTLNIIKDNTSQLPAAWEQVFTAQ
ncbi:MULTISPECIES: filamentous hemagglutinin N-terminal domain-containing protein [unclassified Arsenophonus]|uniref:two-partner secretion domain-containing protein n=1 Tax=unclassified Arsenophonus TaxID=2627083 RepID=UPI00285E8EBD|nr:filamentous hemagglutinin N-terminal domain-containing protein [Arsenophonus sp.]MDR5609755.1 filamentous hemagglutinin N-terminal domain-containing protein [Arsenophonus sp.]MDR5613465.1 filamentous hemagglutinin N-terminal domain-containing protein [Arsenophonus sp.]